MIHLISLVLGLNFSVMTYALPAPKAKKPDAKMSFESQVVEGEIYRPDYSVVTGEAPGEGWGMLRLRANFDDHARTDQEETRR